MKLTQSLQRAAEAALAKPSTITVSVQLPPPSVPWSQLSTQERVKPTRSGFIPPTDPAYTNWTAEMDTRLEEIITSTPEGYLQDWSRIHSLHASRFPSKSARDLRMRWTTFLKPAQWSMDKNVRHVRDLNRRYPGAVNVVKGRWCLVPDPLTRPGGEAAVVGERKLEYATDYTRIGRVGPTSLELSVQALREREESRRYLAQSSRDTRSEVSKLKRDNRLIMEEVEWIREEDLALREAFEAFGDDWERVGRALRVRKRSAAECRERMCLLHQ